MDHINGLPNVLKLLRELWEERKSEGSFRPPLIYKYPLPLDGPTDDSLSSLIESLALQSFTPGPVGTLHELRDGQIFTPSISAPDAEPADQTLEVLFTPGHTSDSISLLYPADRALFTGDTVLGQGTAVFEDLAVYISSLQLMHNAAREKRPADGYDILYPAHGPVVKNGPAMIATYISHRLEREAQIVDVLRLPPPEGAEAWTTWSIVENLYAQYPKNLWEPAAYGVTLHLKKLEKEKQVVALGNTGKDAKWSLVKA